MKYYIENRFYVRSRLKGAVDLIAAEGRYHSECCANCWKRPTQSLSTYAGRGRPVDDLLEESFIKSGQIATHFLRICPQKYGGYLLHSVIWPDKVTYSSIIENYVVTVMKRYGKDYHVVFDGYPDYPPTKGVELMIRSKKTSSLQIKFNVNMECSVKQNEFIANPKNKSQLIKQLSQMLNKANTSTIVAKEDADTAMIERAIDVSQIQSGRPIVVVGQDTDLFVLFLGLPQCQDVQLFFHKPSGTPSDISKIQKEIGDMKDVILFLHAITGCDTTCYIFGKGKINAYKLLSSSNDFLTKALQFYEKQADKNILKEIGEAFVLKLYG